MLRTQPNVDALRPFVAAFWARSEPADAVSAMPRWERVLPTGRAHIVFRLNGPLQTLDLDGKPARVGPALVGGPRDSFYWKQLSGPTRSVGVQLHSGAVELLLGVPAADLAGRHVDLKDLWGRPADTVLECLQAAESHPERQLDILERLLLSRLRTTATLHPAVAYALRRFVTSDDVRATARATGFSQRYFSARFQEAVGLSPKRYLRVRRFCAAAHQLASVGRTPLAALALATGYADQAHLSREFREFTGVTPTQYRAMQPLHPHHLPASGSPQHFHFVQDSTVPSCEPKDTRRRTTTP